MGWSAPFLRRISSGAFKVWAAEVGHAVKNMVANLDLYFVDFRIGALLALAK